MRLLMVALLMAWASTPAVALDAEKERLGQGREAALGDGRFDLSMTQMAEVPASPDGRFELDSGFDPQATSAVSDGRYTLSSDLRSKAAPLTCGSHPDLLFSNGFEL